MNPSRKERIFGYKNDWIRVCMCIPRVAIHFTLNYIFINLHTAVFVLPLLLHHIVPHFEDHEQIKKNPDLL